MGTDTPAPGTEVHTTMSPPAKEQLRSVVGYLPHSYTIHYIRDDVATQYTQDEIQAAIDELRLETLEQPHVNSVFGSVHGDQQCRISVFDHALELNFILDDGTGARWLSTASGELINSRLLNKSKQHFSEQSSSRLRTRLADLCRMDNMP